MSTILKVEPNLTSSSTLALVNQKILQFLSNGKEPTELLCLIVEYQVDKYCKKHEEVDVLIAIDACPFLQNTELSDMDVYKSISAYFIDVSQSELLKHIQRCRNDILNLMMSICKVYEYVQPTVVKEIIERQNHELKVEVK